MSSLFTKIIDGALPGRFVWRDDVAVAFLTINPIQPGHALIVPRTELDNWLDLDADTNAHLMRIARTIGRAQQVAFDRERVALVIAGLEIPHVHLHTIPFTSEAELNFALADPSPAEASLDAAADAIRAALHAQGATGVADA